MLSDKSAEAGEQDFECELHVSVCLNKDLKDGFLVNETHLLYLS